MDHTQTDISTKYALLVSLTRLSKSYPDLSKELDACIEYTRNNEFKHASMLLSVMIQANESGPRLGLYNVLYGSFNLIEYSDGDENIKIFRFSAKKDKALLTFLDIHSIKYEPDDKNIHKTPTLKIMYPPISGMIPDSMVNRTIPTELRSICKSLFFLYRDQYNNNQIKN